MKGFLFKINKHQSKIFKGENYRYRFFFSSPNNVAEWSRMREIGASLSSLYLPGKNGIHVKGCTVDCSTSEVES